MSFQTLEIPPGEWTEVPDSGIEVSWRWKGEGDHVPWGEVTVRGAEIYLKPGAGGHWVVRPTAQ